MLCPQIQKLQSAGGVVSVGGVCGTLIRVIRVVSTDPEATERGGGDPGRVR